MQLPAGACEGDLERFGDLDLAFSLQNFNQKWQTGALWNMTIGISVKADPSSTNFIFSLPDNLFKPKERVIPEKEMHMRSKRYKSLWFRVCPWIFFFPCCISSDLGSPGLSTPLFQQVQTAWGTHGMKTKSSPGPSC